MLAVGTVGLFLASRSDDRHASQVVIIIIYSVSFFVEDSVLVFVSDLAFVCAPVVAEKRRAVPAATSAAVFASYRAVTAWCADFGVRVCCAVLWTHCQLYLTVAHGIISWSAAAMSCDKQNLPRAVQPTWRITTCNK